MIVYLLEHSRKIDEDVTSSVIIGIYESMDIVNYTIDKYKKITGFKDYPDDFVINEFEVLPVNKSKIRSGQELYFLQHEYSIGEDDYITEIGVFLTKSGAKKMMRKLKNDPKYKYYPGGMYPPHGFVIDKYIVNEDNWVEGFIEI